MKKRSKVIFLCSVFIMLNACNYRYTDSNPIIVKKFDLSEDSLLLVVKVKSTFSTDFFPDTVTKICNEERQNCFPWAYWYVHEAKVLDVLKGEYSGEIIKVAMLQHADYIKEIKKEWYVELKKFTNQDTIKKLGTNFYIGNQSSEFSIKH